jgi:dTDP-4-amino-4,6-dideoxygalactose transaminase
VGTFGQVAAFSTMSGKHHCTGSQGGVVYTPDQALYQACRRCSDRGKPFALPAGATNAVAALNLNLNDLAAAIGRVQLRKLPGVVARRQAVAASLAEGMASLACVSVPTLLPGAEASYWFLRLRFHAGRAACDKATYCQALSAEGLPITPSYHAALPHTMDWFVQRRVFGHSGYPWASPDYAGDRQCQFPCPNAYAAVAEHFNLHIHENWQDDDVRDALAIFRRVDAYYRSIS